MWLRRVLFILIGVITGGLAFAGWGLIPAVTLLLFGAVLIAAGVMGQRLSLAKPYAAAATILLNTIILLMVIETAAAVIVNLRQNRAPTFNQVRAALPYYAGTDWGTAHWQEIDTIPNEYAPFVVWEQAPFSGQTVTMREDGTRLTPGANCEGDVLTVYMLGGSTLWGMGSPDEGTIPAYVQAMLDENRQEPVCVVNFGVPGYVSTQGVIKLMTELQQGRVPDVVIFYDGVNDVLANIQNNGAGAHQNLSEVATAFEPNTVSAALLDALRESYTFRLLREFVPAPPEASPLDWEQLADETTNAYLMNYAIVDRLAQEYGFEYGFFWQPVLLVSEKPLLPEEAQFRGGLGAWEQVYALTYAQVQAAAEERDNLYYIAGVFDDVETFIWVDPYHIVPEGNAIVAETMLDLMNLDN